ncbi:MAG: cation-transporting P-type ATPase, partial [Rhodoferax sp.]
MNLLRSLFVSFLKTRHTLRHFRRLMILDSLSGPGVTRGVPDDLARELMQASSDDVPGVLARLHSHEGGLAQSEIDLIAERVGPNEVEHEKPLRWWQHLWHCYRNPFNLLLTVLAA